MSFNKILILCIALFSFSSCFEIVEEVNINSQNGGTYILTANFSKSKLRLHSLMKLDTFMGAKIPRQYELNEYINKAEKAIKETPGVSLVSKTVDFENFIFTIRFDFDKTATLNNALNNAARNISPEKELAFQSIFGSTLNIFIRNKIPDDSLAAKLNIYNKHLELIQGASIRSIYRFPKEVKGVSNSSALVSKNKKAVMLKQNIPDIILHPILFTNTINF